MANDDATLNLVIPAYSGIPLHWHGVLLEPSGTDETCVRGRITMLWRTGLTFIADRRPVDGSEMRLVIMLPRHSPDLPSRAVEASCRVRNTILATCGHKVSLSFVRFMQGGKRMLEREASTAFFVVTRRSSADDYAATYMHAAA